MKKNLFSIIIATLPLLFYAQVGVGTNNPASSSALDVNSTSKGLLIPQADIKDISKKDPIATTSSTLPNSLLVYNTNTTTEKGFYYWKSEIPAWTPLVDKERIFEQIPTTIFYNTVTSSATNISNSDWVNLPTSPNAGDVVDNSWNLVTGLESIITITKSNNVMSIISEGIAQVDDTSELSQANSYAYNVAIAIQESGSTTNSFIISRPISRDANSGKCDYTKFTVETVLKNQTPGVYTIRTYVKKRGYTDQSGNASTTTPPNLYIGGAAPNCSSVLNDNLAKANQVINLTQRN